MRNANIMPINPRFNTLVEHWGRPTAEAIVAEAHKCHKPMKMKVFLDSCTAMGGNWGGMLLSGMKELFPTVWNIVPDDMGVFAFEDICCTLFFCGVDSN